MPSGVPVHLTQEIFMSSAEVTTREQYLSLFPDASAAIEHEQACLSIGAEFLPASAKRVLATDEPTSAYWQWLASQLPAS
jgi:hypothetical protein